MALWLPSGHLAVRRPSGCPLVIWPPCGPPPWLLGRPSGCSVGPFGPPLWQSSGRLAARWLRFCPFALLRPTPYGCPMAAVWPFPPRPTGRPSGRSLATRSLWPPSGSSALLPTRWERLGRMLPHTLVVLSTSFDRLVGATSVWAASISDTLRFSLIFVPFSGFQSLRFSFEVLSTGSRL